MYFFSMPYCSMLHKMIWHFSLIWTGNWKCCDEMTTWITFLTLQDFHWFYAYVRRSCEWETVELRSLYKETAAKLLFLMRSLLKVHKMNSWWKCHVWLPPVLHFVIQNTFYKIFCWKCPPKSGSLHETYGELCFPEVAHCAIWVCHIKYSLKILKSRFRQWIFNKINCMLCE